MEEENRKAIWPSLWPVHPRGLARQQPYQPKQPSQPSSPLDPARSQLLAQLALPASLAC